MYVRDNVVSAKCFSGKCNFWKVFFGKVYRIQPGGPLTYNQGVQAPNRQPGGP